MGAMLNEMLTPKDGHRDELSEALLIMPPYEATLGGSSFQIARVLRLR